MVNMMQLRQSGRIRRSVGIGLATCVAIALSAGIALAQVGHVTIDGLTVRTGPGESYPMTNVFRRGDRVEVIRRDGDWVYVRGDRGAGWVPRRHLSVESGSSSSSRPPSSSEVVYESRGRIETRRYRTSGVAEIIRLRRDNEVSLRLRSSRAVLEYVGEVGETLGGDSVLRVRYFRSSELGDRYVPARGTCDLQTRDDDRSRDRIREIYCDVQPDDRYSEYWEYAASRFTTH
ncbi:MAG: SH3 domain-containing protein [Cyanobacteriota bacterium]